MTGKVREHGGGVGRVEGTMMEPERGLAENRKWTQTKSREYRRPGGERLLRLSVGKPHKTEAKAFYFSGRFTGTQILFVTCPSAIWYSN